METCLLVTSVGQQQQQGGLVQQQQGETQAGAEAVRKPDMAPRSERPDGRTPLCMPSIVREVGRRVNRKGRL